MSQTSARSKRDADATTPVRTTFLGRGTESVVHEHVERAAWMHVLSGEIVEDRWTRHEEGFVHERRALRAGQSMAAPGGVLHRVRALGDAVFVTTCSCGCLQADAADVREVRRAQRGTPSVDASIDAVWATPTATGAPSPR